MSTIRVVIADDEPLARKRIRKLLMPDRSIDIVGEARNGREAATMIREKEPGLVFLDIQMPGMDGFEVVAAISGHVLPLIVFVTAYDQYALRAFKVHALDYLLKPFDDDEFAKVLAHAKGVSGNRAMQEYARSLAGLLHHAPAPGDKAPGIATGRRLSRFVVKDRGRIYFVPAESVDWIEASGKYVVLHAGDRSHIMRETMHAVLEMLEPKTFVRIHRSAIVNVHRIKELQPWGKGEYRVILTNGVRLTSSRPARDLLDAIVLK